MDTLLRDAVQNRKATVPQAVSYVKDNSAGHLSEFLKYKQYGLKGAVQKAAFQKTVNDLSKKSNISRQQAVLSLLYDDFLSDLWSRGKQAAGTFWSNNKQTVYDLLKSAVFNIAPKLLALGGKDLKSEDPYAVDTVYLQTLFSQFQTSQCPRQTIDPLAIFKNQSTYPIIAGSNGYCTVVINPYAMFFGAGSASSSQNAYPFVAISSSNTNLVYNGATLSAGPFVSQVANIQGFFPDQLKVSFMCTQSALAAQGKVTCSVYYAAPNASFNLRTNNTFDGTLTAITAAQQLNLMQGTVVKNVPEAINRFMQLARWIPTANDFAMDLLIPSQDGTGSTLLTTVAFVVLNFQGLTPSTQAGQIYVSSCASFKPVSNLGGLYETKIRGGFEGTHRVIHQLRKKKVKVNFAHGQELKRYIVSNFAQLPIGSSRSRGGESGFCVDDALISAGLKPFGRPWITVKQLEATYPGVFKYVYQDPVDPGLYVNVTTAHALHVIQEDAVGQLTNGDFIYGECLDGRNFATDMQIVLLNPPYTQLMYITGSKLIHGGTCQGGFFDAVNCRVVQVGNVVPEQIQPITDWIYPLFYKGQVLTIENGFFWLKTSRGVDRYSSLPYEKVRYFLTNYTYSLLSLAKKQMLKSNVQRNPGPNMTKRPAAVRPPSLDICYQCALKTAIYMRAINSGLNVDQMSMKCDDHADPQEAH